MVNASRKTDRTPGRIREDNLDKGISGEAPRFSAAS